MTEAERKWFESLKKCLNRMPDSVEILVQELTNSPNGVRSEVHLMKKGIIFDSQAECEDLAAYNPVDHSIEYTSFEQVSANNHGY